MTGASPERAPYLLSKRATRVAHCVHLSPGARRQRTSRQAPLTSRRRLRAIRSANREIETRLWDLKRLHNVRGGICYAPPSVLTHFVTVVHGPLHVRTPFLLAESAFIAENLLELYAGRNPRLAASLSARHFRPLARRLSARAAERGRGGHSGSALCFRVSPGTNRSRMPRTRAGCWGACSWPSRRSCFFRKSNIGTVEPSSQTMHTDSLISKRREAGYRTRNRGSEPAIVSSRDLCNSTLDCAVAGSLDFLQAPGRRNRA